MSLITWQNYIEKKITNFVHEYGSFKQKKIVKQKYIQGNEGLRLNTPISLHQYALDKNLENPAHDSANHGYNNHPNQGNTQIKTTSNIPLNICTNYLSLILCSAKKPGLSYFIIPTKHLSIFLPASLWYLIFTNFTKFKFIWFKF